jgi:hypothetical protein
LKGGVFMKGGEVAVGAEVVKAADVASKRFEVVPLDCEAKPGSHVRASSEPISHMLEVDTSMAGAADQPDTVTSS